MASPLSWRGGKPGRHRSRAIPARVVRQVLLPLVEAYTIPRALRAKKRAPGAPTPRSHVLDRYIPWTKMAELREDMDRSALGRSATSTRALLSGCASSPEALDETGMCDAFSFGFSGRRTPTPSTHCTRGLLQGQAGWPNGDWTLNTEVIGAGDRAKAVRCIWTDWAGRPRVPGPDPDWWRTWTWCVRVAVGLPHPWRKAKKTAGVGCPLPEIECGRWKIRQRLWAPFKGSDRPMRLNVKEVELYRRLDQPTAASELT